MAHLETCLTYFQNCFGYGSGAAYRIAKDPIVPTVILDTCNMGNDVVIVKNGHRICGTGAALASAPVVQNKAYFEVKVQQTGLWGVGLATLRADLNRVPMGADSESWVLRGDGTIRHNGVALYTLPSSQSLQEGDIIGVTFDHSELCFRINDAPLDFAVNGAKGGDLYPVVYVDDGAILDTAFSAFQYEPPLGFDRIIVEKSLL